MELRQLKYFMELANTLNYSRAAELLYISQPTLSQQISALEKELNAQLFYRNRRYVELSPAGEILLDYCLKVFDLLEQAQDKLRLLTATQNNSENAFVIGVDESAPHLEKEGFFSSMDAFHKKNPNCRSHLKMLPYKAILPSLQSGNIDVCVSIVTEEELKSLPCHYKLFGLHSIVLFVPKAFAELHPDDCLVCASKELELCLSSSDQRWSNNFKRLYQRMGFPFHPLYYNGTVNLDQGIPKKS